MPQQISTIWVFMAFIEGLCYVIAKQNIGSLFKARFITVLVIAHTKLILSRSQSGCNCPHLDVFPCYRPHIILDSGCNCLASTIHLLVSFVACVLGLALKHSRLLFFSVQLFPPSHPLRGCTPERNVCSGRGREYLEPWTEVSLRHTFVNIKEVDLFIFFSFFLIFPSTLRPQGFVVLVWCVGGRLCCFWYSCL